MMSNLLLDSIKDSATVRFGIGIIRQSLCLKFMLLLVFVLHLKRRFAYDFVGDFG